MKNWSPQKWLTDIYKIWNQYKNEGKEKLKILQIDTEGVVKFETYFSIAVKSFRVCDILYSRLGNLTP